MVLYLLYGLVLWALIIGVIGAVISAVVAYRKKRPIFIYSILGFLSGILFVVAVMILLLITATLC